MMTNASSKASYYSFTCNHGDLRTWTHKTSSIPLTLVLLPLSRFSKFVKEKKCKTMRGDPHLKVPNSGLRNLDFSLDLLD